MRLSHGWERGVAAFDDANLVSCAGLVPVMELAEQTGLSQLFGRARPVHQRAGPVRSGEPDPEADLDHRRPGGPARTASTTLT